MVGRCNFLSTFSPYSLLEETWQIFFFFSNFARNHANITHPLMRAGREILIIRTNNQDLLDSPLPSYGDFSKSFLLGRLHITFLTSLNGMDFGILSLYSRKL